MQLKSPKQIASFVNNAGRKRCAAVVLAAAAFISAAAAGDRAAQAQTMNPDPKVWRLVVDQDYRDGDNPELIKKYCGHTGAKDGPNLSNFAHSNVYWHNGALVLKFEKRRNTSCTGVTRNYAGGGFELNVPASTNMAAEIEAQGTNVWLVQPYMGLFARGVKTHCEWGAEDDFFEMNGANPGVITATYHYWDNDCNHMGQRVHYELPDNTYKYHTYGVIRSGGSTKFYLDGALKGMYNNMFHTYPVKMSGGVLAKDAYFSPGRPDDSHLPETILIRRIRVWQKK